MWVVSAFRRTWRSPAKAGHYGRSVMPKATPSLSLRSFGFSAAAMLLFVAAYLTPGVAQQAPRGSPDLYSQLRWRFIGPGGHRISPGGGVPGDPLVSDPGSASGGIPKAVDGGVHWQQM